MQPASTASSNSMKNFPFCIKAATLSGSVRSVVLKKRSGRKTSFTRRAIAGASASSAARISGGFGKRVILLQEKELRNWDLKRMAGKRLRWARASARHLHKLVGLAELTVGQIAKHDGVGGALELLFQFGGTRRDFLAQRLAEFFAHFGVARNDLHVEPEKVAHLVEGGFESLDRFHLGLIGQRLHEFGIVRGLHGGAVELALNHAQVVSNSQNAEMNFVHAFPVLTIHGSLSVLTSFTD